MVYILEAHPVDAWQDDDNVKDKISVASARTLDQRCEVADTCLTKLSVKIPPLVDDIQDSTEAAYTAWPDRLYVIDQNGRVAYKSKPGPYGFKPDEAASSLKKLLPMVPSQASVLH